ncbi:MAG: trimethylamine methyltransferase family protein, partial [Chloroflexota bacterium]
MEHVIGACLNSWEHGVGRLIPCLRIRNTLALYAGAQMARYYNMPYRSGGNFTASRIPDAQAGYESSNTMLPTV